MSLETNADSRVPRCDIQAGERSAVSLRWLPEICLPSLMSE